MIKKEEVKREQEKKEITMNVKELRVHKSYKQKESFRIEVSQL